MQDPRRRRLHLYVETADPDELREAMGWRIVDGVSTTPALLAGRSGEPYEQLLELCELVDGPVSAEVTSLDSASIVEEARALASLSEQILVRVPCSAAGIPAIVQLSEERIPIDASLCFSVAQAVLVAKAGARLISVPIGALDAAGGDGLALVSAVLNMLDQYDTKSSVVATGLQNPGHLAEVARMGVDAASMPVALLRDLATHPLSESARREQLDTWRRAQN